jgi:acetyl-CoA acetyltransferase
VSAHSAVIVGGARTSVGRLGGALKDLEASDLAGVALERLQERIGMVTMCIGRGRGIAAVFESCIFVTAGETGGDR